MPNIWNAIYLGNSSTFMDPYEGNASAENAGSFVGNTYGSSDDPLAKQIVEITATNEGGLGDSLDTDNRHSDDTVSYDLGDGVQTHVMDTAVVFNTVLTYTDGSQINLTSGVMQDTAGNLFLVPSTSASSSWTQAYEAKAIQSISVKSVYKSDYDGLYTTRYDTKFVCFAGGSLIDTPNGAIGVEKLKAGDLVNTLDHGPQPIMWKGGRRVLARGPGRAYRVASGALGEGLPAQDLVLSAQHRVMLRSPIAARMTGSAEVLMAVTRLAGMPGIAPATDLAEISYHHILFARHELVRANGSWCETLLPGRQATEILGRQALRDISERLPNWAEMTPARPILEGAKGRKLVDRHRKNAKPLVMRPPRGPISGAAPRTARA